MKHRTLHLPRWARLAGILLAVAAITATFGGLRNVAKAGPDFVAPHIVQWAVSYNANNPTDYATVTLPNDVTAGDQLVVLMGWGGGNQFVIDDWCCSYGLDTMFGSGHSTYVASDYLYDSTWGGYANATLTYPQTISIYTYENCNPCASSWWQTVIAVVEISGGHTSGYTSSGGISWVHATENGTGGTTHSISGSSYSADSGYVGGGLTLGLYVDAGSNTTITAPSGETLLETNSPTANTQYALVSGTTSKGAEFDTSGSAGYSSMVAADIFSEECDTSPTC